ncbi:hypothetical protein RhiJN_27186 [Ceratobasidium sp. AG-Ba]|nr:hypothetical protein RhiJN_27186 [Ceratobasidium sp. AG-Ba]
MPPRKGIPKPKDLQSSSAPKPMQTYTVRASGSRNITKVTETKISKEKARRYQENPPEENLIVLQQAIKEDWEYDALREDNAPTEPTPPEIQFELETLMDDAHDGHGAQRSTGKGQNEILDDWHRRYESLYLDEILKNHSPPSNRCGWCGDESDCFLRCDDCLSGTDACVECMLRRHRGIPSHRLRKWTGAAWTRTTLREEGFRLALGSHSGPCPLAETRDFTLGDLTGIHEIKVSFCRCRGHGEDNQQLLSGHILPCSDDAPSTGFTFAVLREFYFLSTEGKVSASRFWAMLARSSNNMKPHLHINRFREFLRATRMWVHLQDLKHNGAVSSESPEAQSLALRCPACPRLDVNHNMDDVAPNEEFLYTQQISYDGSFQLVRKNKASDEHDLCLSDGTKYWVNQKRYKAHLEANRDTAYQQSTRGADCNNHRAANDTWTRRAGVAESGVGAVTCARHTFYMPGGVVNYYKGERFAYTDFAVLSVLHLLFMEAAIRVGVFYDIYCHWIKNLWDRIAAFMVLGFIIQQDRIFGGVGKYHIAGHTDSCYAQYSPNNMQGIGRLDAEGCERAWADMNLAARSSSEKGPGFRIEFLNSCMHDWNWRKLIGMVSSLLTKYKEAVRMASETLAQWETIDKSIDASLRFEWEQMSILPQQIEGTSSFTSVFLSREGSKTSMSRALLELNKLEADDESTPTHESGLTAPSWISEGIEIEHQQYRLQRDLKRYGSRMTDHQALECFNRRSQLSSRIIRHREHAAMFVDVKLTSSNILPSLAEETDGRPEIAALYLPSQLGESLSKTERSRRAVQLEYKLRTVTCVRGIHRFKMAAIQKRNLTQGKQKNARGQNMNTRAQGMIDRLTARVDAAVWEYENSRKALNSIGIELADSKVFKPLRKADVDELGRFLATGRELGEGYRSPPWFWSMTSNESNEDEASVEADINEGE